MGGTNCTDALAVIIIIVITGTDMRVSTSSWRGTHTLAQVIGAMGEAGVIRKTTDPGVQLIDYP